MAALDNYEVGATLGQGSFAVVKSVVRKRDKARFAMKLVDMEKSDAGGPVSAAISQVRSERGEGV